MDTLMNRIRETIDPDELIDILNIDIDTLCDLCYDIIQENEDKFYFLQDEL